MSLKIFLDDWLGTVFAPQSTFAALSARPAAPRAALALLIAGLTWSGLFFWLAHDGRVPTFTRWLVMSPPSYYRLAAWYVVPLLFVLWVIYAHVAHVLCGRRATSEATLAVLGFAYAIPLTWAFLVPDLVVYGFNGHLALGQAARVTGPLTFVWIFALSVLGLRVVHRISRWKAFRAALLAFILQAVPATLLLR